MEDLKSSEKNLSKFFVHHKYHMDLIGVEHRPLH